MATVSTTRITNRMVDANPQGSLDSVKDMVVEWNDNGVLKKYRCSGGTSWKLIQVDDTIMESRTVDTIADIESLDDIQENEMIYAKDGGTWRATDMVYEESLNLIYQTGVDKTRYVAHEDKTLDIGDSISIDVYIREDVPATMWMMNLNQFANYIRYNGASDNFVTLNFSLAIFDRFGNALSNFFLPKNTWITVKGTATAAMTGLLEMPYFNSQNEGWDSDFKNIVINIGGVEEKYETKTFDGTSFYATDGINKFNRTHGTPVLSSVPLTTGEIKDANDRILEVVPDNGWITPQHFGFVVTPGLDYDNDASDAIQACLDSEFNVLIPAGNYYLSKPLYIRIQKHIRMMGSANTIVLGNNPEPVSNSYTQKFITWLYSDQNIDFIVVQAPNVLIEDGLIDTSRVVDHTECGIKYDLTYRVFNVTTNRTVVQGSEATMGNTGKGSKAFFISLNVDPEYTGASGYGYNIKFNDNIAIYCMIGIGSGDVANWPSGSFMNTTIIRNFAGDGCKKYIDLQSGGLNDVHARCQDRSILNDDEKYFYPFSIGGSDNVIDCFCFDQNWGAPLGAAPHPHSQRLIYAPGGNNMLGAAMVATYHPTAFKQISNFNGFNSNMPLNNPYYSFIGSQAAASYGVVSDLNNPLRYRGVTYKGFLAPDSAWFDSNLESAQDALNPTPLVESTTQDIVLHDTGQLNSAVLEPSTHAGHTIKKALAFAEITISIWENENIYRLGHVLSGSNNMSHDKIQVIFHTFIQGQPTTPVSAWFSGYKGRSSADLPLPSTSNVSKVTIRYIGTNVLNGDVGVVEYANFAAFPAVGSYESTIYRALDSGSNYKWNGSAYYVIDEKMSVQDIYAVIKGGTPPVITSSSHEQSKSGPLTLTRAVRDGHTSDTILDIAVDDADVNLRYLNPTIFIYNSSGSTKRLTFYPQELGSCKGAEWLLWCTDSAFSGSQNSFQDSANFTIEVSTYGIQTKDGQPLILRKGEWIKVRSVDLVNNSNYQHAQLMEVARSRDDELFVSKIVQTTGTKVLYRQGATYNYVTPDNAQSYNCACYSTVNAWAVIYHSTAARVSFPTITNSSGSVTVLPSDSFQASQTYEILVKSPNGTDIDVKFIKR